MKLLILSAVLIGLVAGQAPYRDFRCPLNEDTKRATHLPHPTDCGSFLKCNYGNAVTMRCPRSQHWNDAIKICDSVEAAKCSTSLQPPQRPDHIAPQRPNIPPSRPTMEHPDFLNCPAVDVPGQIVYFPYHLNCSQFYQCSNGRAVL